ncbi:PEP-CTERM sorting domain-containing protein [Marinobacter sp. HL-58]|uniref:PEP-CTERM sorting domain-containing protein n=1 Tax=Marinobacter sp. HL-58 TaxID=1479237 RepID=UPI0012DD65A8|nr:PEP-CTERM sorting domain-containing protein [Marinobacter sp. HL-58]
MTQQVASKPPDIFTPPIFQKIQIIDSVCIYTSGLKYAASILNPLHGRFAMKNLMTGLTVSLLSTSAMAGTAVVVPEPGMLGLFAASVAALFIARKFRK